MSGSKRRVVKLGGSLLEFEGLLRELPTWLRAQCGAVNVIVVGGGRMADVVRQWDRAHRLPDETSHKLAVSAMGVGAHWLASMLPNTKLIFHPDEIPPVFPDETGAGEPPTLVLDVQRFVWEDRESLPASWDVTSDSIAARVAVITEASELVLLKSSCPPRSCSVDEAAAAEYIDPFFSQAARGLKSVRCVNLREQGWPEVQLTG